MTFLWLLIGGFALLTVGWQGYCAYVCRQTGHVWMHAGDGELCGRCGRAKREGEA